MVKTITNEPEAGRTAQGLRDTGYNVNTAIADIVDNSVAAEASLIQIEVSSDTNGRKFIDIIDNGIGMDRESLIDAMRYGSQKRANPKSLGKFGLGMKTAATSICKKLTVTSRAKEPHDLNRFSWDIDHIEKTSSWAMIDEEITTELKQTFKTYLNDRSGTIVSLSNCDRILNSDFEAGSTKEKLALERMTNRLADHLGMVFHRFLDKEDNREKTIEIMVNGKSVQPWNPLFPAKSQQVLSEQQQIIKVEKEYGGLGALEIRAFIIPHKDDLTKTEQEEAKITNNRQGFYVYREGRLLSDGGWLGVFGTALEPHMSLARVEFDFNFDLDEAFQVDIKKSRIQIDPSLEEHLKKLLSPFRREAENRYRKKKDSKFRTLEVDHKSSNKKINEAPNTKVAGVVEVDELEQQAIVSNNKGPRITIKQSVESDVPANTERVVEVEDITDGNLWEPSLRDAGSGFKPAVRLNIHHDFYKKIYLRTANAGYAVEGMDILLWAFAAAEQNNTDAELRALFEDIREEVSSNIRKVLRDTPEPDDGDLA